MVDNNKSEGVIVQHILYATLDAIKKRIICNQDVLKCFLDIKNFNSELFYHSVSVAILSMILGNNLYDNEKEITELFIAALFHDYGKVYIQKNILEKQGKLDRSERKLIEQHPVIGYNYLKQNTNLSKNILFGILEHHEKIDGSGYNLRKNGNNISKYAKIISIIDVYDAMISDRVYRKCIPKEKVTAYLYKMAGILFDYNLTIMFLNLIDNLYDLDYMKQQLKETIVLEYF